MGVGMFRGDLAQSRHERFNVATIQQTLHRDHPEFLCLRIMGVEQSGYLP